MKQISSETQRFIQAHRNDDVRELALHAQKFRNVDIAFALSQIAGRQMAMKKLPEWAQMEGLVYPKHLSMEQCSSEVTARYKASLVEGDTLVDLTAGFGVDCAYMARNFRKADYVERQSYLCEQAVHNFSLLGLNHIQVHCEDAVEYLKRMSPVDCLYLDPARRDNYGRKTVEITDCEPNVLDLEHLLVEKAKKVVIKLSPMLDIFSALRVLEYIREVHVVAVDNECKELLITLMKTSDNAFCTLSEPVVCCEQVVNNFLTEPFRFTYSSEKGAKCTWAETVGQFLYEPGVALLKAGPYRLLSEQYGVRKLHPNSHLYTSDTYVDFPGRRFWVEGFTGFGKNELKSFLQGVCKANLTVRNFPATVVELRKKLKLKEGGDTYLFATTMGAGEKVLIKCVKMA